jgi:hypothetical protein
MYKARSGKLEARQLQTLWGDMARDQDLHPEIRYRIRKMSSRLAPLTEKIFFKTVRAGEMLRECREWTVDLNAKIDSRTNETFFLLTRLERTFENLLRKTYAFRIKAG